MARRSLMPNIFGCPRSNDDSEVDAVHSLTENHLRPCL